MSSTAFRYTFLLHTCNLGTRTKTVVNPFTKQQFEVPVEVGLTAMEVEGVEKIFAEHRVKLIEVTADEGWATYANERTTFRCFDLEGATPIDSIHVEDNAPELTSDFLEMILALTREGNFALTSDQRTCVRIVDRQPNSTELTRWPDAKTLSSTNDLEDWLRDHIKGRRVWNDNEKDERVYFSA